MIEGFYLSKWQGKQTLLGQWQYQSDLHRLRAERPNIGFVYVKATQGKSGLDPLYAVNRLKAEEAGFPVGCFHYFTNQDDPIAQARHFYNVCGGRNHGLTLLPSGDVEDPNNVPADLADKVYAFQQETVALWGVQDIPYTRRTYWDPHVRKYSTKPDQRFAGRKWWVAHYNAGIAAPWIPVDAADWAIWQVAELAGGTLPGLPARVTRELLNPRLTVADISFPKPVAVPAPAPVGLTIYPTPAETLSMLRVMMAEIVDDLNQSGQVGAYIPYELLK